MSGRGYAKKLEIDTNIAETARQLMQTCNHRQEAVAMLETIREGTSEAPALKSILDQAEKSMAMIEPALAEIEKKTKGFKRLFISLKKSRQLRESSRQLASELDAIAASCRTAVQGGGVRMELAALSKRLEIERESTRPWADRQFDALTDQLRDLIEKSDRQLSGSAAVSTGRDEIRKLAREISDLRRKSNEVRFQDQQRRYVLEALTEVCKELGFGCDIREQKRPSDDLVSDVDTYSHGVVRFRLLLDGSILSDSEMQRSSCPKRYAEIEDNLRNLGVTAEFRHEDDGLPIRAGKNAKSAPRDDSAASFGGTAA